MLDQVLKVVCDIVVKGGCVLFVGIKCQVQKFIVDVVEKCVQYYMNYCWLGGILINWQIVLQLINCLKVIDEVVVCGFEGLIKKECLGMECEQEKL